MYLYVRLRKFIHNQRNTARKFNFGLSSQPWMHINISYFSIMSAIQCGIITRNIMNHNEIQYILFTLAKRNYNPE